MAQRGRIMGPCLAAFLAIVTIQGCLASSRTLEAAAQATSNIVLPKSVGTSFKAAYHYVVCQSDYLVEPETTQEVADVVKAYRQLSDSQGAKLKIRASRRLFHSTTSFVCPNQFGSMPNGNTSDASQQQQPVISVGILQDKMNKTVAHDPEKHTMTIQAGMKLREFAAEATRLGMSIQVGSLPAYAGLTVGGVLSTSAHGSGDQATSTICDTLVSLTWIDHRGDIQKSPRNSKEVHMLCGGLGLIGLVTELEVQMTPPTHTKLITRYLSKDDDLVNDVEKMLKVSPHILVFWRPDMKLYSAYMLKPVSTSVPASDAYMTLLPNYKGKTNMATLFKTIQEDIFDHQLNFVGIQESVLCPTVASYSVGKGWASNPDGSDVLYTVGKTNNMMSGECWDDCAWNGEAYNGTAEDVHLSIEFDQFRDWVQDIKNIFVHDLWATDFDKGRCLGPGYVWLRFGHGGPDYLSMHYNMTRPVYVQSTWLKNRVAMDKYPMRYGFVTDLLEEISLCKYGGRPHWGKNFRRTFTHPKCPIEQRFSHSMQVARKMQAKHDPDGIFEPELWKSINNPEYALYPRCALKKDCYCQEDIHCPEQHACVSSKAPGLQEYKVCKPDWRLHPETGRLVEGQ